MRGFFFSRAKCIVVTFFLLVFKKMPWNIWRTVNISEMRCCFPFSFLGFNITVISCWCLSDRRLYFFLWSVCNQGLMMQTLCYYKTHGWEFIIKMTAFFILNVSLLLFPHLLTPIIRTMQKQTFTCFVFIYHRHTLHMTITLLNTLSVYNTQNYLIGKKTVITCIYMFNKKHYFIDSKQFSNQLKHINNT